MREADCARSTSGGFAAIFPLPSVAAALAVVMARQAAMARPDPDAWQALAPDRRAGFNDLAEGLAREFLRLRRLALATPATDLPSLRAKAAVLVRTEPSDDPAASLARDVLAVLPAPPVAPTLRDLTEACARFADDVEAMGRAAPAEAGTVAAVILTADMLLPGATSARVRAAMRG